MEKALCICEKPSLMRAIQSAYNNMSAKPCLIDFIALHGHVVTLKNPRDYKEEWGNFDKNNLPYILMPEQFAYKANSADDLKLIKTIKAKAESNEYQFMINATDAEREGQCIFYSVYRFAKLKKPVKRLWIHDLNEPSIQKALLEMKDDLHTPFFRNLTSASFARQYSDWLVGMNFTTGIGLPCGRVMSAVEVMLADRELEIRNFVPHSSYNVEAKFNLGYSGEYVPKQKTEYGSAFNTKDEALSFISACSRDGYIKSIDEKEKNKSAPLLYSLGTLQIDGNRAYGYTSSQVLSIIQSLYETHKILTYPRTDSPYITIEDITLISSFVTEVLDCIPSLSKYKSIALNGLVNYSKSEYVNYEKVNAHGAIIFTGKKFDFSILSEDEKNITLLIGKRILATLLPTRITLNTHILTDVSGRIFKTEYVKLLQKGWSELYSGNEKEVILPEGLKEGLKVTVLDFSPVEVKAKKPSRYNDATLLSAMIHAGKKLDDVELQKILKGDTDEKGGIGTPATRSAIIEKIIKPQGKIKLVLFERKGKDFYVTDEGLRAVEYLRPYSFSSALMTAQWERKLNDICDGKLTFDEYMKGITAFVYDSTAVMKKSDKRYVPSVLQDNKEELSLNCPFCDGKIIKTNSWYYCGRTLDKSNPCGFKVWRNLGKDVIDDKDINDLISSGKTNILNAVSKEKSSYKVRLLLNLNEKTVKRELVRDVSYINGLCSCGGKIARKNGKYGVYYECDRCKKIINGTFGSHKLTEKEIGKLYVGESTDVITTLKNKNGEKYSASLKFSDGKIVPVFPDKKKK